MIKFLDQLHLEMYPQPFQQRDFTVDKRKIDLEQPIKSVGEYKIKLKLAENIQATINLSVIGQD